MQPLRPQGHLAPPRLTTMWPISPAAPRPSQGLPSRIRPPPTPVPQKTPIRVENSRPAPSWNSASVATWTSLPTLTSVPSAFFSVSAEREAALPAGQVACAAETTPVFSSASPGEPTPTPARSSVADAGGLGRLAHRRGHRLGDVLRAAARRRRVARFAEHLAPARRRSPSGSSSRRGRSRPRSAALRGDSRLQPEPVGRVVGDDEDRAADDHQPVVPVVAAARPVDRHLSPAAAAFPCSTAIRSWLTGSSLTRPHQH